MFVSKITSKKIAEYSVELQAISGKENSQIIETMEGARTVKQLKKEEYFFDEYKNILDDKYKVSKKLAVQIALYSDVYVLSLIHI